MSHGICYCSVILMDTQEGVYLNYERNQKEL